MPLVAASGLLKLVGDETEIRAAVVYGVGWRSWQNIIHKSNAAVVAALPAVVRMLCRSCAAVDWRARPAFGSVHVLLRVSRFTQYGRPCSSLNFSTHNPAAGTAGAAPRVLRRIGSGAWRALRRIGSVAWRVLCRRGSGACRVLRRSSAPCLASGF